MRGDVHRAQGRPPGRMEALGFALREQAVLQILIEDVTITNEMEGEKLDVDSVRCSIARGFPRFFWWNLVSNSREKIEIAKHRWENRAFPMVPGETRFISAPD